MRSGFVSIVGRPNVGKSTLLNKLINKKLAITSDKVGTTRNNIYGIYNEEDTQIIFIDTPGIGKAVDKLGATLNKKAYSSLENDLVLFLVDIASGFGKNDEKILDRLKQENKKVILVLNKIDKINKEKLFEEILKLKNLYDFLEIVPISGLKGNNTDELVKTIKKHLPDDIKYFDDDIITNTDEVFMIGEIIREKVLNLTKEEVPHSVTCLVENIEFKKGVANINALIIVDRKNLKKIIIGKNGSMLKRIGTLARKDIESYLNMKVYLELYVKTIENWKNKEEIFDFLKITEKDL
ncbi:MAG: GTPase Era [Bacilli bacterium]